MATYWAASRRARVKTPMCSKSVPIFNLGVIYDERALSLPEQMKSIWLEFSNLRTADPDALKRGILDSGIAEIEYWDKTHFYFQAPGGQSFVWPKS
jgi:hypothetical protein